MNVFQTFFFIYLSYTCIEIIADYGEIIKKKTNQYLHFQPIKFCNST